MANVTANMLCKKGSAQAFTAKGETITAQYRPKVKSWYVEFSGEFGPRMTDDRNRNLTTAAAAAEYINSMMDAAKTAELKWW